jgi:MHS family proline/betaine transporter-like MFS transporter
MLAGWAVCAYTFYGMPAYLAGVVGVPLSLALTSNLVALVVHVALLPVMGHLSDRVGRKPLLIGSMVGFAILTYPAFLLLTSQTFTSILAAQLIFAALLAVYAGAAPTKLAELVPTRVRYSALSIGYNVGVAVFGGTAPFVNTYLFSRTGSDVAPAFYVIIMTVVTLLVLVKLRDDFRSPLKAV